MMSSGSTSTATAAQDIEQAVPLFSALSDSTRLKIVTRLARKGPQSITTLARDSEISRQAVTKHLNVLEKAGLAASRRNGREHIFELEPERLDRVHHYLNQIARQWNEALNRLQVYLEQDTGRNEKQE